MFGKNSSTFEGLGGVWTIDPDHSRIGFVVRHAMVTKVRGAFSEFDGTVKADDQEVSNTTVNVAIKVASLDTRNEQRDQHVLSEDFLNVEKNPEITFNSTEVKAKGETLEITGDLTIMGTTKSVTIPFEYEGTATDPFGNVRAGFEGSTVIDRKDFGLTWNAALDTGGVLVGEKITLEFEISAIKNA